MIPWAISTTPPNVVTRRASSDGGTPSFLPATGIGMHPTSRMSRRAVDPHTDFTGGGPKMAL